ncbi:hypothetical protein GCM10023171_30460 [Microbacterium panaciterrae]|uniref:Uncharacterized protein n=1 Tax=Microbacterium panaciterrae TaxID=985759 RepID=A0ABP8PPZ9_9MICO
MTRFKSGFGHVSPAASPERETCFGHARVTITGPLRLTMLAAQEEDFGSSTEIIDRTPTPLRAQQNRKKDAAADWSGAERPSFQRNDVLVPWQISADSAQRRTDRVTVNFGVRVSCSVSPTAAARARR